MRFPKNVGKNLKIHSKPTPMAESRFIVSIFKHGDEGHLKAILLKFALLRGVNLQISLGFV